MGLYTLLPFFFLLYWNGKSTGLVSLPPLVTHYSLFVKLYIKLFVERNKTVCPGPISFLEVVIFLSLKKRHFKSFSLYDPRRNVMDVK